MSRRKQPNPNKVKQMEGASEDKRLGEEVSAALSSETEQSQEKEERSPSEQREEHEGTASEEAEHTEPDGDGGDQMDTSPTNPTPSSTMNTSQLNGTPEPASSRAIKSPATNRIGRRSQDAKEERSTFTCPLCDKACATQHQLTMHIRQHNSDSGGTDHSCSICGKALSSASSLDRHMLVHSGERPYKCSVCGQTFTTNGNMHRHMKIHDKDPTTGLNHSPPSPAKRRRPSAKRKPSLDDEGERVEEPPYKKGCDEGLAGDRDMARDEDELQHCPICFKTFVCKYGLETHMEMHPDTALRCDTCCITFRTHRGLLRHNAAIHKQLPTDPAGRPFIQSNPSIPLGFNDLAFIDFSCRKFPHIAQVWCETNLRRCTSKFHRFVCETCNRAFPLQPALDLHLATHETGGSPLGEATPTSPADTAPAMEKSSFMGSLGLQHISQVKLTQTEEEQAQQAVLDSIRVIRVESAASGLSQEVSGISIPFLDPTSLHSLSQVSALNLLSLQPFVVQPESGIVVKSVSGENGVELADIQQILKMASSAPNQITLPPLSKAPSNPTQGSCKQMPPLKPKPLVTPRSNMAASTPPPLVNTQQASPCCVSPSLPPPPSQPLKSPMESSSSFSSSYGGQDGGQERGAEKTQLDVDALTPMDVSGRKMGAELKEAAMTAGKKLGRKGTFSCRHCEQVFSSSSILQAHMRHHQGVSPHRCSICDYVAPDKATLIRHLRTHSGERPYVCRVCHYPFTVKANCERHLRKKHMKTTRKEIERNIEYVTASASSLGTTVLDAIEPASGGDATCCYCGEDLKSYRALQIHLRTSVGCQRKSFECRQCGSTFTVKRNCINHLQKQHPEVQEIEEHITTLLPVAAVAVPQAVLPQNGKLTQTIKVEEMGFYPGDSDQPLDFSSKGRGGNGAMGTYCGIKQEAPQLSIYDCSLEPIDLSIPKNPEKRLRREVSALLPAVEVKREQPSPGADHVRAQDKILGDKAHSLGSYQVSLLPSATNGPCIASRAIRLKPLLPKPASATASTKELPPLASIAQIISSVSVAPALLKREAVSCSLGLEKGGSIVGLQASSDPAGRRAADSPSTSPMDESSLDGTKKTCKGKPVCGRDQPDCQAADPSGIGSGIDLESSGEFASVEKILATTDTNKFSPYLQSSSATPTKDEAERPSTSEDEKDGQDEKRRPRPPAKGKKNAYSSSLQKMTCPYCPRVFPWASSLQRHMLTHTGQKPFPCPECDAFFSTKSNCERHLLRKHGVASRSQLRHNGAVAKLKADEGSPESAESLSDAEHAVGEALDLSASEPGKAAADPKRPAAEEQKPEPAMAEGVAQQAEPERGGACGEPQCGDSNPDEMDDDSLSNKSLDLNFARKLIDFKFAPEQEQPQPAGGSASSAGPDTCTQDESKHTCASCGKSFRHAATLARHQRAHLAEGQEDDARKVTRAPVEASRPPSAGPEEQAEGERKESDGTGSGADSGSEDDDREKEERSDEEGGGTEPKSSEGEAGSKADKRKKVCSVCNKRFWSLQDLTRHMRSHTGERPYKCQTCERTFTLKHSLVRHQRIHQKPRGEGPGGGAILGGGMATEEEGASGRSGSESESTPGSANPSSENESEGLPGGGAKPHEGPLGTEEEAEQELPQTWDPAQAPSKLASETSMDQYLQGIPDGTQEPSGEDMEKLLELPKSPVEHMLPGGEPPMVGVE